MYRKKQVAENYADYEYNLYGTFFNINYYIPNSIQLKLNQLDNITNVNTNQFYKYKVFIYEKKVVMVIKKWHQHFIVQVLKYMI